MIRLTALCSALICATSAQADPHNPQSRNALHSPDSRSILHGEIRALLLNEPAIVQNALNPPADPYADEKTSDRNAIRTNRAALEAANRTAYGAPNALLTIALFTTPNCPDCRQMQSDLAALAKTNPIRITLFDLEKDAALARAMGATSAPYTVFPDTFLNGQIPAPVLQRYITKALTK